MPAPGSTDARTAERLAALAASDLVIEGRMPWSSNATFLCELWPTGSRPDAGLAARAPGQPDLDADEAADQDVPWDDDRSGDEWGDEAGTEAESWDDDPPGNEQPDEPKDETDEPGDAAVAGRLPGSGGPLGRAIYKPLRGERPLWDFPDGLYRREAGAFDLAVALGWDCVPPTIVRHDAPLGPGSLQWFVDADFDQHHFTLVEDERHHPQLRRMCAFDILANSTDRKGGHVLIDDDGHLWGIDNGLSLHAEFKLRTVIWEFALEPLPTDLATDLARFVAEPLPPSLCDLLDPFERDALLQRARTLLSAGRFPTDPTGRRYPWPLV